MKNLSTRDSNVIWHPYTQAKLAGETPGIVRGSGAILEDENGNQYIDAISSWWVNIHGHAHPLLAESLARQASTLEHVIFAGFTHEPAVQLAEKILEVLPGKQSKIFYSDNGSTAVEVAVKMALQYWKNKGRARSKIIALEHAYHGDTFGAMSVSARGLFTDPFSGLLFDVLRLPFPDAANRDQSIQALKRIIHDHKDEIAALIVEPLVLGAGGMLMYDKSVLENWFQVCRDNGILIIADEVMTGFGRTGTLFACDQIESTPDIICLSKGLTGGMMPLGATTCTQEIFDAFYSEDRGKTFFHGHSYTANPLACAVASTSLELLLKKECQQQIARIEKRHQEFLHSNRLPGNFKNRRCTGTILALDWHSGEEDSYLHPIRDRLYQHFIQYGVLLRPLGNTVYILPPYCITDDQLDKVYEVISNFHS